MGSLPLIEAIHELARIKDREPEVTQIIGGAVEGAFAGLDALDLVSISNKHRAGYTITIDGSTVKARFDSSLGWTTPVPFTGSFWPTDVRSAIACDLTVEELGRRTAGACRVVRFTGYAEIPGQVVDRVMTTPNVIDVRFYPSRFDVLLAREAPTLGGLAHLVATRKIHRRRRLARNVVNAAAAQLDKAARESTK